MRQLARLPGSSLLSSPTGDTVQHVREEHPKLQLRGHFADNLSRVAKLVGNSNVQCKWNGKLILKMETDLTIDLDASLKGWGALATSKLWGPWSEEEARMYINCLELLAATLAVKSFAKNRTRISILLRINNTIHKSSKRYGTHHKKV